MKKLGLLFLFMAFVTLSFGQAISGSAHDFSGDLWSGGRICIACHTPHNSITTVSDAPLWNHELSAGALVYTAYSSGTMNATLVDGAINSNSKLCLSCHDGTVALENFGATTGGTTFLVDGVDAGFVGTDLSDDHPIGFTYDAALATADGGLHNPTTQTSGLGLEVDDDMLFGAGNDQMECASCHDPHGVQTVTSLLRKSNAGSALCLTCHNK